MKFKHAHLRARCGEILPKEIFHETVEARSCDFFGPFFLPPNPTGSPRSDILQIFTSFASEASIEPSFSLPSTGLESTPS